MTKARVIPCKQAAERLMHQQSQLQSTEDEEGQAKKM